MFRIDPQAQFILMNGGKDIHLTGLYTADSLLVAAARDRRPGAPLNSPLVLASNFVRGTERAYARDDGTPTREALEEIVGLLEGGQSVAFASGMADVAAVFDQLNAGSHIVLPDNCYQGVAGLAELGMQKGLWTVSRLAVEDTDGWISTFHLFYSIWPFG